MRPNLVLGVKGTYRLRLRGLPGHAQGHLSAECQNQVKLDGSYMFRGALNGLNIGLSTYWFSGLPLTAYGYSLAYQNWEYYLTPRGSLLRRPSNWGGQPARRLPDPARVPGEAEDRPRR